MRKCLAIHATAAWAVLSLGALAAESQAEGGAPSRHWYHAAEEGPAPRLHHAMAHDAARGRTVLFGGIAHASREFPAATWQWDGTAWLEATAGGGPSPRTGHAMAYDTARERVLLYGGLEGASLTLRGDLWEWDGAAWNPVQTAGGPGPRTGHTMAYDTGRERLVLYGGFDGAEPLGDTWEWDGAAWELVAEDGPSPRSAAAMAHDEGRGRTVLYGGRGEGWWQDTWEWDGAAWELASPRGPGERATHMAARSNHAMIYDAGAGEVVLFGGLTHSRLSRTWAWDGTAWRETGAPSPRARSAHAMAYDVARGETVLFGGWDGFTAHEATWLYGGRETPWFDFEEGPEGWAFANPPGFVAVEGTHRQDRDSLSMEPGGIGSFGFWESPFLMRADPRGGIPEAGVPYAEVGTGPHEFLVAHYLLASEGDPASAPDIRLRSSSPDFFRSDVRVISPGDGGLLSPAEPPRLYRHIFRTPVGSDGLRLHWDLLDFLAGSESGVELLHVSTTASDERSHGLARRLVEYNFQGRERHGFSPRVAPPIASTGQFQATDAGLLIRGGPREGSPSRFGYWGLESGLPIRGGALYRMEWWVRTDGVESPERRAQVPTFRLRVNDSSMRVAQYTNIDSRGADSRIPRDDEGPVWSGTGNGEIYVSYFEAPEELDGETLVFSFDYLYSDQSDDDPEIGLILWRLRVDEIAPY